MQRNEVGFSRSWRPIPRPYLYQGWSSNPAVFQHARRLLFRVDQSLIQSNQRLVMSLGRIPSPHPLPACPSHFFR